MARQVEQRLCVRSYIYWAVVLLLLVSSSSRLPLATHFETQHSSICQTPTSLNKMHFKLTSFLTMAICAALALGGPIEKRCDPNDPAAVAGCNDCTENCANNANGYAQAGCYAGDFFSLVVEYINCVLTRP